MSTLARAVDPELGCEFVPHCPEGAWVLSEGTPQRRSGFNRVMQSEAAGPELYPSEDLPFEGIRSVQWID